MMYLPVVVWNQDVPDDGPPQEPKEKECGGIYDCHDGKDTV